MRAYREYLEEVTQLVSAGPCAVGASCAATPVGVPPLAYRCRVGRVRAVCGRGAVGGAACISPRVRVRGVGWPCAAVGGVLVCECGPCAVAAPCAASSPSSTHLCFSPCAGEDRHLLAVCGLVVWVPVCG